MDLRSNYPFQVPISDGPKALHTTTALQLLDHGSNAAAHTGSRFDDFGDPLNQAFEAPGTGGPGYNGAQDGDRGVGGLTLDAFQISIVNQDVSISGRREHNDRTDLQNQFGNGHGHDSLEYKQYSNTASGSGQATSLYAGLSPSSGSDLYPKTLDGVTSNGNTFDGALSWRQDCQVEQNDLPQSNVLPRALEIGVGQATTNITSWSGTNQEYSEVFSERESITFPPERPFNIGNTSPVLARDSLYQQTPQVRTTHPEARSLSDPRKGKHKASSPPADDHPHRSARPGKRNNITEEHAEGSSSSNPQPRSNKIWACPLAKQSNSYDHPCFRRGFEDISRVKQHLKRSHSCESPKNRRQPKGWNNHELWIITADHRKQFEQKMPAHSEESWNKVFQIVFPNDPLPSSPYLDNDTPEPYAAFGHDLESNLINEINGLKPLMKQEVFDKLKKIIPETIHATFRDCWAKSSSGSQSGNSSHGQHDQEFKQQNEDTYASASVPGSVRMPRPMGQSVGDLSHHTMTSHMAQDEIPTQQQNSPYNARYTCINGVYQYSQSAATAWESTNPNASTYNFPNQLDNSDSLEQAEQECFPRPSTESNTGQSLTISESGFKELPVGFYGSTTQYQQQHNWGQHQHQHQHQEQKQDEEIQQQQLQVSPDRNEYQRFIYSD